MPEPVKTECFVLANETSLPADEDGMDEF